MLQVSTKLRDGPAQAFSEGVATFGLIAAILGSLRFRPEATPFVVGLYITSAYWFTASTSFANPAVTLARSLSDTFAGIAPVFGPGLHHRPARGRGDGGCPVRVALQEGIDRMSDFPITIYHNPACGTSRNTLAMIRAAGYEPTVVEYLRTGWTRPRLKELLASLQARPRDILREKGTPAAELGLLDPDATDDRILDAMVEHPVLVNRPIVVTPKGVLLSRPSEAVLKLLERAPETFVKEDARPKPGVEER